MLTWFVYGGVSLTRLEIPKDHAYSYAHYAKLRNGFSAVLKSDCWLLLLVMQKLQRDIYLLQDIETRLHLVKISSRHRCQLNVVPRHATTSLNESDCMRLLFLCQMREDILTYMAIGKSCRCCEISRIVWQRCPPQIFLGEVTVTPPPRFFFLGGGVTGDPPPTENHFVELRGLKLMFVITCIVTAWTTVNKDSAMKYSDQSKRREKSHMTNRLSWPNHFTHGRIDTQQELSVTN